MLTAIYAYEPTIVNIVTSESNLELCEMGGATPIPLSTSMNVARGIYKIVSTQHIDVTSNQGSVVVQLVSDNKDDYPQQPPPVVAENFAGVTVPQLQAFFKVADGRDYLNP